MININRARLIKWFETLTPAINKIEGYAPNGMHWYFGEKYVLYKTNYYKFWIQNQFGHYDPWGLIVSGTPEETINRLWDNRGNLDDLDYPNSFRFIE